MAAIKVMVCGTYCVATLLLCCAVFVLSYGQLSSSALLNQDQLYSLVTHLLLSGALLGLSGRALQLFQKSGDNPSIIKNEFVSLWPSLVLSGVNITVAVQVVWMWHANQMWIAALIIPGLVGLTASAVLYEHIGSNGQDRSLREMLSDIVRWSSRLLILGFGLLYWRVFSGVLLGDQKLTASKALHELKNLYQEIGPQIFAFIVVALVLFAMSAVAALFYRFGRYSRSADRDRKLSSYELQFIERSYADLKSYVAQKPIHSIFRWLHGVFYIGFLPIMLLAVLPLLTFEEWILPIISNHKTSEFGWALYIDHIGISGVLFVFCTIFVYWSVYLIVCWLWPSFFEWVIAHTNFPWTGDSGNQGIKLLDSLEHAVRRQQLPPGRPFSPQAFLRSIFYGVAWRTHLATAALVLVTLFFLYKDHSDYDLFTDKHIETVDYWSAKRQSLSYADVKRVEISCSAHKSVSFNYRAVIDDTNAVRIFSSNKRVFAAHLKDYERINQKLKLANARFVYTETRYWLGFRSPTSKKACQDAIHDYYDSEKSTRVLKLLHLDVISSGPFLGP